LGPGPIQGEKLGVTITYHLKVSVLEKANMALMEIFKLKVKGNGRQSE